jgi:hypothetical protein
MGLLQAGSIQLWALLPRTPQDPAERTADAARVPCHPDL